MGSKKRSKGRFALLPRNALHSSAVKSLSHFAFRLLTVAAAEHNGHNNGDISLAGAIIDRYGLNRGHASRAIKLLIQRGLLVKTRQGGLGFCSLYALPWYGLTDNDTSLKKFDRPLPSLPDMGFIQWRPKTERQHPKDVSPTSSGRFSMKGGDQKNVQRPPHDAYPPIAPTSSGCTSKNLPIGTSGSATSATDAGGISGD